MEKIILCKGGCGNRAKYAGWCGLRWKRRNKISVNCPETEKKRAKSISKYRIREAKLGLNPMQNPEICKKNHSVERNKRASKTFKELAKLKLLPQQTESKYKSKLRLSRIRKALQKLATEGKINHQIESLEKKKLRHKKISETIKSQYKKGFYKIHTPKKIKYKSKLNSNIYLHSKWELEVARFLDNNKIKWLYEPTPISYWNYEISDNRITIPDFFLPKYKLFIEVKSNYKKFSKYTDDKIEGIKKAGFKVVLWKDKEIELIRKNNCNSLLENIKISGGTNA